MTPTEIFKELDSSRMIDLLREIRKISRAEKPANVKQTMWMKELFNNEITPYNSWIDRYHSVCRHIESEILYRIEKGEWEQ